MSSLILNRAGDCAMTQEEQPSLKIYYIPFYIEHFVNTRTETIEGQSYMVVWIYDNPSLISEILDLVKGEKPSKEMQNIPIENLDLRLKLENVKEEITYFVGKGGLVISSIGDRFVLNETQIENLERAIIKLRSLIQVKVDRVGDQLPFKS